LRSQNIGGRTELIFAALSLLMIKVCAGFNFAQRLAAADDDGAAGGGGGTFFRAALDDESFAGRGQ